MELFKWKDSFNLGIEELDQQHRTFLEYLNECYEIVSEKSGKHSGIEPPMIERLRQYATIHFHREEDMLRFASYPDMEQQQKQHIYFESKIRELEAECEAGKLRSAESIFEFLRDWFLNHILQEDKKFVPLIRQGRIS
jgi:hemerythrin